MSSMTSPRGPHPARVYWVRRGLAVLLALALVFAIGKVLTSFGGNDGGGRASATSVAQKSTAPTARADAPGAGSSAGTDKPSKASTKKTAEPLSVPTGQCQDGDVVVTPTVTSVDGGGRVSLPLRFTTAGGACTWRVSAQTVVLKVTSGSDRIWSSQDCTASIPTTDVVVRPDGEKPAVVDVGWSGRRSSEGCPPGSAWADPGYYHVSAASLGGEPTDVQFEVAAPPRPTVTKTTHPKPTKKPKAGSTPKG